MNAPHFEADEMNAWIKTEQQLPPIGERVLMKIEYVDWVVIGAIAVDGLCYLDGYHTAEVKWLTHWQPLPELPPVKIDDDPIPF